ncbi:MAG: DsbA family protein [Solirubrobacteraceae bacterium]
MISVTHFTDPGCPWAYSASPSLAVLRWRYGAQLQWRLVTIGLTERYEQYVERGYSGVRSAQGRQGFRRFGMPLTADVRERPNATARGCRAIHATRLLHPGRDEAAFRALQFAWFTTGDLMDEADAIEAALRRADGVDPAAVVAALDRDDVTAAYEADRAEARTAAGSPTEWQGKSAASDGPVRYTAPSVIFRAEDGRSIEAGGFQPLEAYDVCLANLDRTLERRPPAESAADAVAAFPDGLTTQEVAAIMTPDLQPVRRDAAERELLAAVGDGALTREALGDDALWRPAA